MSKQLLYVQLSDHVVLLLVADFFPTCSHISYTSHAEHFLKLAVCVYVLIQDMTLK